MRIGLFHATLPEPGRKLGGVEVAVHRLATELALGGDAVTVFSLTAAPPDARYTHRRLFRNATWLARSLPARWLVVPFLLNFVRFGSLDVLHLHGDDWFFVRRRRPTVRTLHGSALLEARSAGSWKRRLTQRAIYPLEHVAARLATLAAAVGEEAAGIYGVDHVVDNGVDLERFRPGPKSPHPTVLFIGTWEGRKRGRWLFDVFLGEILPRVPEAELWFVADQCPSHPRVRCIRFPDDAAMAALYREAWVFAYPSVYEGFGIPYVEALASGTAIVASPNAGARHVLGDAAPGSIVDDASFGARVVELLVEPGTRGALEARGPARAGQFTWKRVAEQHRALYALAVSAGK